MNKEEIKDIMKDMDDKTVEKISADYKVGDDSAKERIYKEIVRRMNSENDAENTAAGDEVRGVETYRRRNITRIISAAAAFIIVAGAVGGGAYLLKDHKSKSPVQTSDEIVEATTSPATAAVTERTTEPTTTVKTVEVTTSVAATEAPVTTTEPAAVTTEPVTSSEEQGNGAISKQEIYDKCISNAIESYAYTFESECITKNPHDSSITVDRAKKSSSPDLRSDSLIELGKSNDDKNAVDKLEYYTFDDKEIIYIFDSNYGTNTKIVVDTDVKSTRETDEEKDQGTTGTLSAFTTIEQICDTPSDMAKKLLTNFSTWEIKGKESYLSRECAIIEGWGTYEALNFTPEDEVKKVQYTLYVDIETGAWLKASYNDKEFGDMNFEVKRFSLGDEAEKPISKSELKAKLYKLIDEEGYAIIDMNDENIRGKENIDLSFLDE